VRQKLITSLGSLPDYTSTEVIEQSKLVPIPGVTNVLRFPKQNGSAALDAVASCAHLADLRKKPSWGARQTQSERTQLDVAVSKNGESYREVQKHGSGNADPSHYAATSAATSLTIFLKTIFLTDAAKFTYKGQSTIDGRSLAEFDYAVPAEKSGYSITTSVRLLGPGSGGPTKSYTSAVPYAGTVLVDPQTLVPVRIIVHADRLPPELKLCETTTTLDYAYIPINGSQFLLLKGAVTRDGNDDGSDDVYEMQFSNFHEFRTSSTVVFEGEATDHQPATARQSVELSTLSPLQERQLAAVRQKVMATIDRLPKYLCTETIDRLTLLPEQIVDSHASCADVARSRKSAKWKVYKERSDRLRLDVAVSRSGGEMYSWVGEDRFQNRSLADLAGSGATSTGAFGDLLRALFGTDAGSFTFDGEKNVDHRELIQFSFRVSLSKSLLTTRNKTYHATIPYYGQLLADPDTFDLVRLIVRSDELPEQLHACKETTILDFSNVRLNDAEFLLPQTALFSVQIDDGKEYENRTLFSSCREFVGKSTLVFDSIGADPQESNKRGAPGSVYIPAGLHFVVALSSPIETATAAAGDTVTATLTGPIRNGTRVLASKGAIVTGRIVKVERQYQPPSWTIVMHLETIQNDATIQAFHAQLTSEVKRVNDNGHRPESIADNELGSFYEMPHADDPGAGVLRFEGFTGDYIIHRGWNFEGITTGH
jgi:hypothetical protein